MTAAARLARLVRTDPAAALRMAERIDREEKAKAKRSAVKARPGRERKAAKKKSRREFRAAIRAEVFARAAGRCECVGGEPFGIERCLAEPTEWDHQWSRRDPRDETVRGTWALCHAHHLAKTRNRPSRRWWLKSFACHAARHGYFDQVQRANDAVQLEEAQHPPRPQETSRHD